MRKLCALLALSTLVACAPLAREHRGDAAFRKAIAAQLSYDEPRAEALYREVLALGLDWSPVWNNLAVIQVHRHEYSAARKLLAQAVAANDRDVVALTNYGVISYHLSDYAEARRTLEDARRLRMRLIDSIPSMGRASWGEDQYARATQPLDETARRYLARIDSATISDAPLPAADLMADVRMNELRPSLVRF
jgi:Tfp pilus assembly protein PilF